MNKPVRILPARTQAWRDLPDRATVQHADAGGGLRGTGALCLAVGLAVSAIALVVLMLDAGLSIIPASAIPLLLGATVALGVRVAANRMRWRHARVVGDTAEFYLAFALVALTGALASYPISAMTHGYSDATLQRIDLALGFDWPAWYRTVAASPMLQFLGTAAYRSIYLSPAVLLAYYAATAQRAEAYRFLVTFWLCAVITLVLFKFMPAVGPLSYLWHAPIAYMPESELWQPDLIPQLRAHSVHSVDLGHLRGIVSAPSFHAAAATLYAAAAWRIPRLRNRWSP